MEKTQLLENTQVYRLRSLAIIKKIRPLIEMERFPKFSIKPVLQKEGFFEKQSKVAENLGRFCQSL